MNTKAFDQIDSYPIKKLLHKGMKVTLNSDDMTVSNTNLPHEYKLLEQQTNLTPAEENDALPKCRLMRHLRHQMKKSG